MLKTNLLGYGPEDSLDPAKLRFVQEYFAIDNMTAKLVGTGKDGQYIIDLAESLEFSDDKKTTVYTDSGDIFLYNNQTGERQHSLALRRDDGGAARVFEGAALVAGNPQAHLPRGVL